MKKLLLIIFILLLSTYAFAEDVINYTYIPTALGSLNTSNGIRYFMLSNVAGQSTENVTYSLVSTPGNLSDLCFFRLSFSWSSLVYSSDDT